MPSRMNCSRATPRPSCLLEDDAGAAGERLDERWMQARQQSSTHPSLRSWSAAMVPAAGADAAGGGVTTVTPQFRISWFTPVREVIVSITNHPLSYILEPVKIRVPEWTGTIVSCRLTETKQIWRQPFHMMQSSVSSSLTI